jgi:protein phosphatase
MYEKLDVRNGRERLPHYRVEASTLAHDFHPKRNEDACFASESGYLGVFDGVGGDIGSEEASRFVSAFCHEALSMLPQDLDKESAHQALEHILRDAHDALVMASDVEVWGLVSTTAVIAKIFHDTSSGASYVAIAHAGDSRAYLIRNGECIAVTTDHGLATREIQDEIASVRYVQELPDSIRRYVGSLNIITSSISSEPEGAEFDISIESYDIERDDIILLTSDGVHDNLLDREIVESITRGGVPTLVSRAQHESRRPDYDTHEVDGRLVDWHNFRAKPDDITAVALYYT